MGDVLQKLEEQFPGREIVGYWVKEGSIVVNLKPTADKFTSGEVCFVEITNDGKVRPTNPMVAKIMPNDMIKL